MFLTEHEVSKGDGPVDQLDQMDRVEKKGPLYAVLRASAISLPQLVILLDLGARFDLLFGFNNTDTAFTVLLVLLALAPALNLTWFVVETTASIRPDGPRYGARSFLMPVLALLFFLEAVLIDIYVLLHARM